MRNQTKMRSQAGMTIIEIIVVIAIIGVVAAIAMPSYRDYSARAKVAEALLAFGPCKNAITEQYMSGGASPGVDSWGCENTVGGASTYVNTIHTTDEGIIRIELRGDARLTPLEIALAPLDDSGNIPDGSAGSVVRRWRCGNANDLASTTYALNPKYLPNSCNGN
jgi:type IV pilus assembly protein PilA